MNCEHCGTHIENTVGVKGWYFCGLRCLRIWNQRRATVEQRRRDFLAEE